MPSRHVLVSLKQVRRAQVSQNIFLVVAGMIRYVFIFALRHLPAIHFTANKSTSGQTENSEIYKHLMVTVKNMTLALEEELLLKTLKFLGLAMQSDRELERAMGADESAYEAQRALMIASASANATRYYFGNLKLTLNQVIFSA